MRPSIVIITEDRYSDVTMSLVKRVVTLQDAWNALTVDERPFQLGGLPAVSGRHRDQWMNKLRAAAKRRNCAGVLFVMDGDQDKFENQCFCARDVAGELAHRAREAGAGTRFSLACVIARQEIESWLLAGLSYIRLTDNSRYVRLVKANAPEIGDPDEAPRGAKEWLRGYCLDPLLGFPNAENIDQIGFDNIRSAAPRSFRRFESAICQLCDAIRTGVHIATPAPTSASAQSPDRSS